MSPRLTAFLALALAASGCAAESSLQSKGDDADSGAAYDTGVSEDGDGGARMLRIDVYPSSAGPDLLPQSALTGLSGALTDLTITLSEPITIRGAVSGYQATPLSISVPGEDVAVIASIGLTQDDSISQATTTSDASGSFDVSITPGTGYTLSVVPQSPTNLPFRASTGLVLDEDMRLDPSLLSLGNGVPVYGTIRRGDGTAVHTELALVDSLTGVQGPVTETDSTGYYQLRALPGSYSLVVFGDTSRAVPSVSTEVVAEEDVGAQVDVDMGDYKPSILDGDVVDSSGDAVPYVKARFTSVDLLDPSWSLTVETETDGSGVLFTRLLEGTWTAEFIPDRATNLSPTTMSFTVSADTVSFDQPVVVEPFESLDGRVVDPGGSPLSGVIVTAREQGYDNRTWSGTTDEDGAFQFDVPAERLDLTFTPPSSDVAIVSLENDPSAEQISDVVLPYGQPVSGRLLTTDGAVVPYAVVELRDADSDELLGTTLSNAEGEFSARIDP